MSVVRASQGRFSTLFRRLHDMLDVVDTQPLRPQTGLFTFTCGTSLDRQIFPDETLSFGFSASAI
jgi:hypothetical protein